MPRFYGEDDASPRCQGNADAGNCLGNPDIRVPENTEKEDGLWRGAQTKKKTPTETRGTEERTTVAVPRTTRIPWKKTAYLGPEREPKDANSATSLEGRG
ncbi:hypothetical protein NDU88_006803 [Pleurodeles waltl]|uniref:Uncharacterized protein n=1 Tax=Pleurodeles waltl TaxID=8319 RepID=A0AAV7U160_PLEWA|nr:hypothetical protein NDU88_006803 [Pleurodeles waltl]